MQGFALGYPLRAIVMITRLPARPREQVPHYATTLECGHAGLNMTRTDWLKRCPSGVKPRQRCWQCERI